MSHTGAIAQKESSFVGINRSLVRKMQRLKDGWVVRNVPDRQSAYRHISLKIEHARRRRKVRRKTLQSMRR
jgi:hypothetical protein